MKKMFVMAVAVLFSAATMAQTTKQPKKKMSKDSAMMQHNGSDTSMYKNHSKPMKKKMKSTKPMKDSASTME